MKKFLNVILSFRAYLSVLKSRRFLLFICSFIIVAIILLWLDGAFSPKVNYRIKDNKIAQVFTGQTFKAKIVQFPSTESASGTVQAVHEITISSKLSALVTSIDLKAGQAVKKGDLLMRLDDSDLQSQLQQAKLSVNLAQTAVFQATKDQERFSKLIKVNAVSRQAYEDVNTRFKTSKDELKKAQAFVHQIEAMIPYANIISPIDGIVVDKKVSVGNTVMPGQVLLKIYDQKEMQIVSEVRESLTHKLKIGQRIGVKVDALDKICSGKVSEIVPEMNSSSRTFQVKVTGPCPPGIYSGMFGRIIIPLGEEDVLVIPTEAIKKVGQLQLVEVLKDGALSKRYVRSGRTFGDNVEILSGLREGEEIALSNNY